MKKLIRLFALLLLLLVTSSKARAQLRLEPGFAPTRVFDVAEVHLVVAQPDGKLLVAGDFTRADGQPVPHLIRLEADGSLDATFTAAATAATEPVSVKVLTTGQVLIAAKGDFAAAGVTRHQVARLNANGTMDPSFDTGAAATATRSADLMVTAMVVRPDGRIVVGGNFVSFGGQAAQGLVGLLPDGQPEPAFTQRANTRPPAQSIPRSLCLQPDGALLLGGLFFLSRLQPDGQADPQFNTSSVIGGIYDVMVSGIAVQPDGKVLASCFTIPNPSPPPYNYGLLRFQADGSLDRQFAARTGNDTRIGAGGLADDAQICVLPAGQILVSGNIRFANGQAVRDVLRLNADGTTDSSFQPGRTVGAQGTIYSMALLPDGSIVLGGSFTRYDGVAMPVVKLSPAGTRLAAFQTRLHKVGKVNALALQPDGKIVLAGSFCEVNGYPVGSIARLLADGTFDPAFLGSPEFDEPVSHIVLQPDGKLLSGYRRAYSVYGDLGAFAPIRRWLPDGQPDVAFQTSLPTNVVTYPPFVCLPSGRIITSGVDLVNQLYQEPGLLALQPSGQSDAAWPFKPGLFADQLLAQPDGRLLVGVSGKPLQRLLASGAPDVSFNAQAVGTWQRLGALALQPNGEVLVGGALVTSTLLRLTASGGRAVGFGSNMPAGVADPQVLAVMPDGLILVGGAVGQPGASVVAGLRRSCVRLLPDGTPEPSFLSVNPNDAVRALAVRPDGTMLLGGLFTEVLGQERLALACLRDDLLMPTSEANGAPTRTAVWPNPARHALHVRFEPNRRVLRVVLLDALGRQVTAPVAEAEEITLPLGSLSAGVYLLRVDYADGPVTRRVVVE